MTPLMNSAFDAPSVPERPVVDRKGKEPASVAPGGPTPRAQGVALSFGDRKPVQAPRVCAFRRKADGVCRGARDDGRRTRRHSGEGVRARRLGTLGPAEPLYAAGEYAELTDRGANWPKLIRSTPGSSTTSRVARALRGGPLTRSTPSGARLTRSERFRSYERMIRTSIRSAMSPRSRS
jgi:hypothetical protein